MYSQNNEEKFIIDYFKNQPIGRFMDIGAYDVFKFSNVRALFEKGWKGILVEPSPDNFKDINEHYKADNDVMVVNIAVGEENGTIDFYSCQDAVSTSDEQHKNKWEAAGVKYNKIKVFQLSVSNFMASYFVDIDFLTIDTEATNINIFRAIPEYVFNRIKMICIEHDGYRDEIESTLAKYGFSSRCFNGENIILAK